MSSRRTFGALIVVLSAPSRASAQSPVVVNDAARRWAIGLSFDASTTPDAFAGQCGRGAGGSAAWGIGGAAVYRPRHGLVVEANTRALAMDFLTGCRADLPIVTIGPNEYETRPGFEYAPGTPKVPLAISMLRIGAETPAGSPLMRASVGGGVAWGGRTLPVGSFGAGIGTRGRGARFFAELETYVSRAPASEHRARFRADSTGSTSLGSTDVPFVFHPRWTALHLSLEIPLGGR